MPSDEEHIRGIIAAWAAAVSAGDRRAILANHTDDVLMFDFPAVARGIEAYDRTWDYFYEHQRGLIVFAPSELEISVGDTVAFATCQMHCDGTTAGSLDFRLTFGLRKVGDNWLIAHEHHSLPSA